MELKQAGLVSKTKGAFPVALLGSDQVPGQDVPAPKIFPVFFLHL